MRLASAAGGSKALLSDYLGQTIIMGRKTYDSIWKGFYLAN